MVIQLESAAIERFDPTKAIHHWNTQSTRVRRPFFKDSRKPQQQAPLLDVSVPTAESEQTEGEINVVSTPASPTELEEARKREGQEREEEVQEQEKGETLEQEDEEAEGRSNGGDGYDSGLDSASDSECDLDQETVNKRLMEFD